MISKMLHCGQYPNTNHFYFVSLLDLLPDAPDSSLPLPTVIVVVVSGAVVVVLAVDVASSTDEFVTVAFGGRSTQPSYKEKEIPLY